MNNDSKGIDVNIDEMRQKIYEAADTVHKTYQILSAIVGDLIPLNCPDECCIAAGNVLTSMTDSLDKIYKFNETLYNFKPEIYNIHI